MTSFSSPSSEGTPGSLSLQSDTPNPPRPSRIGAWFRYLLSAAIIVLLIMFARTVDWRAAWESMRHASLPLLCVAILANFSTLLFRGARWWLFLRKAGSPSFGLAMRATLASAGLNNILIANGGEAARVVFVTRATAVPSAKVIATVALDRIFDPVGFIGLLVLGFTAFRLPANMEPFRIPAIAIAVVIMGLLVWFSTRTTTHTSGENTSSGSCEITPGTIATSPTWLTKCRSWLSELGGSMRQMMVGPQVIPVVILTFLAWLSQLVTFAFAASAAHVSLPLAASLIALLLVNLSLVIRPTPGNVGLFQVAYIVASGEFGVAKEQAIAISLLIQTIQIIPVTLLGVAMAPEFIFKRKTQKT